MQDSSCSCKQRNEEGNEMEFLARDDATTEVEDNCASEKISGLVSWSTETTGAVASTVVRVPTACLSLVNCSSNGSFNDSPNGSSTTVNTE